VVHSIFSLELINNELRVPARSDFYVREILSDEFFNEIEADSESQIFGRIVGIFWPRLAETGELEYLSRFTFYYVNADADPAARIARLASPVEP
jgi:hypothetical protein